MTQSYFHIIPETSGSEQLASVESRCIKAESECMSDDE
jgi:hypothetical protein